MHTLHEARTTVQYFFTPHTSPRTTAGAEVNQIMIQNPAWAARIIQAARTYKNPKLTARLRRGAILALEQAIVIAPKTTSYNGRHLASQLATCHSHHVTRAQHVLACSCPDTRAPIAHGQKICKHVAAYIFAAEFEKAAK